jgi:antirestriction protein ArdC
MKGQIMSRKESTIDVHQAVTDAIIAAIESGPGQFVLPWQQSGRPLALPTNAATGAAYNGLNILILLCASAKRGYTTGKFASYRQLLAEGKQVRSGERGTLIVFYKDYVPRDFQPSPDTPDDDGHRRVIKHSHVFALEQTVGYEPPPPPSLSDPVDLHPEIQRIITNGGFDVRMGGDKAFFNIRENFTQLPDPSLFSAADARLCTYSGFLRGVLVQEYSFLCSQPMQYDVEVFRSVPGAEVHKP